MRIEIIKAKFNERAERTQFVFGKFKDYWGATVLDVGCYQAPLREMVGAEKYTGVDIVGNPDIKFDLNLNQNLPFNENTFETVIAIETLEHIDNLHFLFSECVRVTSKYLIVSLPNCWRDARRPIERGRGDFAHYGLPVTKPNDRHRWFFNFSEAVDFYNGIAKVHQLKVVKIFGTEQPRNIIVELFRKLYYKNDAYLNRYAQTAWVVFEKNE
jgi:hypothetical protein